MGSIMHDGDQLQLLSHVIFLITITPTFLKVNYNYTTSQSTTITLEVQNAYVWVMAIYIRGSYDLNHLMLIWDGKGFISFYENYK